MKALDVVRLNHWVTSNAKWLNSSERGTLENCAATAATDLGCKVTSQNLSTLMGNQGIPTKRMSRHKSELMVHEQEREKLIAENMELRRTLAKVAASDYVPADFKEMVFAGLKEEIRTAIFSG